MRGLFRSLGNGGKLFALRSRPLALKTRRARQAKVSGHGRRTMLLPMRSAGRSALSQRVWLDVLLYTGLRRGDAVRLGRQHVRDGVATLKTEKSRAGRRSNASNPACPGRDIGRWSLWRSDVHRRRERPIRCPKKSFGNSSGKRAMPPSVPGSAHGVRKIAATRAANAGATVAQLEAIFGWSGGGMASLYTRAADRRRLGIRGDAQARERGANFYCRTFECECADLRKKANENNIELFCTGAAERTRTSTGCPASTSS